MLPPKSHHCETEYRRSFKKSRFNCSASTYQQNLDFRKEQKRRFVEHNHEPFDWDPEDIESESGSDVSCDERNEPMRLTNTQYKHEKLNRLYEKRMMDTQESRRVDSPRESRRVDSPRESRRVDGPRESRRVDSLREIPRPQDEALHVTVHQETDGEEGDSEAESEASVVHVIQPEIYDEPPKIPSRLVVNKQTQTERKTATRREKRLPGPFAAYGYEADAMLTGKKLTHNVRASREIYPSALRAQRSRSKTSQQNRPRTQSGRRSLEKNVRSVDHSRPSTSSHAHVRGDEGNDRNPDWVTEYDQNFRPHNQSEYTKAPRSARIRDHELIPSVLWQSRKHTTK